MQHASQSRQKLVQYTPDLIIPVKAVSLLVSLPYRGWFVAAQVVKEFITGCDCDEYFCQPVMTTLPT